VVAKTIAAAGGELNHDLPDVSRHAQTSGCC
jgi:hypothetical protein